MRRSIDVVPYKKTEDENRVNALNLAKRLRDEKIISPYADANGRAISVENARKLVSETTGVENVEKLYEILDDRNKTEEQKARAKASLENLGMAVYLAMDQDRDTRIKNRLIAGSYSIDWALPPALKGLGDVVLRNVYETEEVRGAVDQVDVVRNRINFENNNHKKLLKDIIQRTSERLILVDIPAQNEGEVRIALEMMERLEKSLGIEEIQEPNKTNQTETTDPGRSTPEEEARLREINEANQWREQHDFYYSTLIHESPQNIDPFAHHYAPEWMKNDPDKILLQKIIQLANAAHFKKRLGNADVGVLFDPKGEAVFNASNEMMRKMYEIPGVRQALEGFVEMFFTEGREGRPGREEFVLRIKAGSKQEAQSIFWEVRDEQLQMQNRLMRDIFHSGNENKDKAQAIKAVSIAWNLLFVGHAFECADVNRWTSGEAVAVQAWNLMHPAKKAKDKILKGDNTTSKGEVFGGQKGQFLVRQVERAKAGHRDAKKLIDNYSNDVIKPFPERLLVSFFVNTEVEVKNPHNPNLYEKMNLAEALYRKREIDFTRSGSGKDSWGEYYDLADGARRLYDFTTGKKILTLEVMEGKPAKEMVDWAQDFADARNKVLDNDLISPHVETPEFLLWSIVASVKGGVYMDSAELVMMTPTMQSSAQYFELRSLFEQRRLVNDERDQEFVMKALNAESSGAVRKRRNITGQGTIFNWLGL